MIRTFTPDGLLTTLGGDRRGAYALLLALLRSNVAPEQCSGATFVTTPWVAAHGVELRSLGTRWTRTPSGSRNPREPRTEIRANSNRTPSDERTTPIMHVLQANPLPVIWTTHTATGGFGVTDWLNLGVGITIGVLTAGIAIVIAWRQRVIQVRDRRADRDQQRRLLDAARQVRERVERRDRWRAEYEETRALLKLGEDIAYRVREYGPLHSDELASLRLDEFTMKAEQLAERGLEALSAPLMKLAATSRQISATASPEYELTPGRQVSLTRIPSTVLRQAIQQDRTARQLASEINLAWQALVPSGAPRCAELPGIWGL